MKSRARLIAFLALTLNASCAASGSAPPDVCGPWKPLLVSPSDVLSTETTRDVLVHNRTGRALGCW